VLIILDRDGVINHDSDHYIKSPEEWLPIEGSLAAIAALKNAGHTVVVATNQSGIARGLYTDETLQRIHEKMHACLAKHGVTLDGVYYCEHHPDESCVCRKPATGMLQQIAVDFSADLSQAVMLGDKLTDIQVAQSMGCPPVLVRSGRGLQTIERGIGLEGVPIFDDLSAWTGHCLSS
jgi:D-glycero-D-manno-heptose 1,7-bisphosphate phosphatase